MTLSISTVRKFKPSKTWNGFIKANKSIIDADVKEVSKHANAIKDVRKQKTYKKNEMSILNTKYTEIWSVLNNKTRINGKYWDEIKKK